MNPLQPLQFNRTKNRESPSPFVIMKPRLIIATQKSLENGGNKHDIDLRSGCQRRSRYTHTFCHSRYCGTKTGCCAGPIQMDPHVQRVMLQRRSRHFDFEIYGFCLSYVALSSTSTDGLFHMSRSGDDDSYYPYDASHGCADGNDLSDQKSSRF